MRVGWGDVVCYLASCLIVCRLVGNLSTPEQTCPKRVFCEDEVYELPTDKVSVFTFGVSQAVI